MNKKCSLIDNPSSNQQKQLKPKKYERFIESNILAIGLYKYTTIGQNSINQQFIFTQKKTFKRQTNTKHDYTRKLIPQMLKKYFSLTDS